MAGNTEVDNMPLHERAKSTSTLSSDASMRTNTTWRYDVFGPKRLGKGAMLFTGPDGIRDHRVKIDPEPYRCIGENAMSPEGTSEVAYLWRAPLSMAHPRPKSQCAGEIGWSVPNLLNQASHMEQRRGGAHIQLGEFRQALEDRHTHLFQNAWYPGPGEKLTPNSDSSHVMNVYNFNPQHHNRPNTLATRPITGSNNRPSSSNDPGSLNTNQNNSNLQSHGYGDSRPLPSWRGHSESRGGMQAPNRRLSNGSQGSINYHSRYSYCR